jgi:hypothetical protein
MYLVVIKRERLRNSAGSGSCNIGIGSPSIYVQDRTGQLPQTWRLIIVPDHDGGRPKQINAWFLYTHMVYL